MPANYQPFPEYEKSGVEWVGEFPAGWEVQPFFVHASHCKRSNKGMTNDNLLSLSFGRVIRKNIETSEGLLPASFETYQVVEPDDVVFRLTDLQNDKRSLRSAICRERGIITSAYLAVQPVGITPSYLAYLMRSYDFTKVFYALGSGLRQSLKYADMKRLPLLVPSRTEQTQIAQFLDHETASIDALIEKQQQLIALLKEKRQAVISHAVTQGLNPDAPMRDSGVEWLGEVPAHWEVKRIKNLAAIISKGTTPSTIGKDMADAGIRFIKGENVGKGLSVSKLPEFYISEDTDKLLERSRLERGDVLVIIAGATTGLCSVVEGDLLPANTNQAVSFVRPLSLDHSHLIARWLSTEFAQRMIWMGAVQAAQPNLSMEDLGNIPIAVPPAGELDEFLNEVTARTEQLDQLIEQVGMMSELLQERRTALISAAVTGKIDVRGWKAPKSEMQEEVA